MQAPPADLNLEDINFAINRLAEKHLSSTRFQSFKELRARLVSGVPFILRKKDGSFVKVEAVRSVTGPIPFLGKIWLVEYRNGDGYCGTWHQFERMLAAPVIWDMVSNYIP